MQIRKKIIVIGLIFLMFGLFTNSVLEIHTISLPPGYNENLHGSSEQYEKDLDSIITKKLGDYDTLAYFPQIYEPSLQAIYYALFIYHALDQLDQIDQNEPFNDTMAYYDSSSGLFYDVYAYRYLDLDPSQGYYPYSSLLQVNCYAIQSLALLNRLGSIDTQHFIDFIWSCYNPISDGFIGQPYDPGLDPMYRISTMDNTYFAVITLNLLLETWDDYSAERNKIIQFVNDLQISLNVDWKYGGFYNDEDVSFDSITPTMEPSLLSCYYCIKALEVFEMEETINIDSFHHFLTAHYKDDTYFEMATPEHYKTNLVATTLGLELSQITAFLEINETNLISFIMSNRNSQGMWDSSTNVHMHELMDTFQIIRSLKNTGAISSLDSLDKMEIAGALNNFKQYTGFSLISREYTTLQLLNTLISSLELFDQISDLHLQSVYNDIEECFRYFDYPEECYAFLPYICADPYSPEFRSFPIEFYTRGYHTNLDRIDYLATHKSIFFALNSMKKMYKLDDFGTVVNLTHLIDDIIQSQFLVESFPEAYGAFVPSRRYTFYSNESQAQKIFFEYSFYAIQCLELLASHLALGNLTTISFDQDALYSYIENNIVETSSYLYFAPRYSDDVAIRFQNTYYMAYVLKALDRYGLDSQKIRTYIIDNVDYTNIKNIYFAFKISHLLNVSIPFNLLSAVELVEGIFSEQYKEYYRTTEKISIDHEIIVWIAEMIKSNFFEYQGSVDPPLGDDQKTYLEPAIPLALVFIIVPGSVFMISNKQLQSKKRKQANKID